MFLFNSSRISHNNIHLLSPNSSQVKSLIVFPPTQTLCPVFPNQGQLVLLNTLHYVTDRPLECYQLIRCLTLRQNCPLLFQQLQLPKAPWLVVKLLVQLFSLGLGLAWFTLLFSCWHCSELTCATSLLCADDIDFLELSIGSGIYTLSSFPALIPEPQGRGIVVYKVPVRADYSAVFGSLQLGQL